VFISKYKNIKIKILKNNNFLINNRQECEIAWNISWNVKLLATLAFLIISFLLCFKQILYDLIGFNSI